MAEEDDLKMTRIIKKSILEETRGIKKGFSNPVVVIFQNGELNENVASNFNVQLTPKINGGTDVQVESPYEHWFKDPNQGERREQKQLIAIRNRKTNKVKLVEVDTAVLINSALLKSQAVETAASDYKKDIKELHKTFGGKKVVIRLDQREKVNVNSMLIANDVKEAVADFKLEEDLSFSNLEKESVTDLLPPCHRQSLDISQVYVLNEILSEPELEALKTEAENVFEGNQFEPKGYSQFFLNCCEQAKKSEDDLDDRLAGLLFAETLIKFLKMPSKRLMSKKVILCTFSTLIHEKILNEFCIKTDSSITRPLTMRDKCLCFIVAISLICCNYQINLKLLSAATSMHLNRLSRLARVVGASQLSREEQIFVLKLPLPSLPKTSAGRARKK